MRQVKTELIRIAEIESITQRLGLVVNYLAQPIPSMILGVTTCEMLERAGVISSRWAGLMEGAVIAQAAIRAIEPVASTVTTALTTAAIAAGAIGGGVVAVKTAPGLWSKIVGAFKGVTKTGENLFLMPVSMFSALRKFPQFGAQEVQM